VIPEKSLVDAQNAVTPMKAVKNQAELAGMRQAHIVDGVAMAKFVSWLEHTVLTEGRTVSEVEIDEKLTGLRAEQFGFTERSFPTIAGVGPNGAIIHYSASADSGLMRFMDTKNPILIDSGGQYAYGTTDVTRNWHFGTPDAEYVDSYTRVLKGHIGLDEMIFPENTPGFALDIYARRWLWDAGKDYGHGTGHGVGAALNVHEGPQGISPRWTNKEVMKAGMVISNEPGYYEDGKYGIRIENLMEVQYVKAEHNVEKPEDDDAPKSTEKKFLKFKKLTMIPMQKNLVDLDMLTDSELDWLDAYHEQVLENISPLLVDDSLALAWLVKSCEKIDRKGR
jgi:Xaa-Pro aminopeptidase